MSGPGSWLPLLLGYAGVAFWGYCLFDFARTDDRDLRTFTRPVWVVVLVLGSVVGGLLWLALGRPRPRTGPPGSLRRRT